MKRIRVTVTDEYLLPDDWEVLEHPVDRMSCLHGNGRHFMPDLDWLVRSLPPSGNATLGATWETIDDHLSDRFFQMDSRSTEICEIA